MLQLCLGVEFNHIKYYLSCYLSLLPFLNGHTPGTHQTSIWTTWWYWYIYGMIFWVHAIFLEKFWSSQGSCWLQESSSWKSEHCKNGGFSRCLLLLASGPGMTVAMTAFPRKHLLPFVLMSKQTQNIYRKTSCPLWGPLPFHFISPIHENFLTYWADPIN
jgi:hypothetical protein